MDPTFSRDEILAAHPLLDECRRMGMEFKKQGGELYAKCPFHNDGGRPNFRVNEAKGTWFCDVCGFGGSVVDLVAKRDGKQPADVWKEWCMEMSVKSDEPAQAETKQQIVKVYDYRNALGDVMYQVCRMHPKTFRQRHMVNGKWQWDMQGVTRVLYRLPEVLRADQVWIVEGEKDADAVSETGLYATCNVGGAGKWMDGYTESLKGKDLVLCGDNDDPGRQHMEKVLVAVKELCRSVRVVRVPDPHKDVSDWLATVPAAERKGALSSIAASAPLVGGLQSLPIKSMLELELEYINLVTQSDKLSLDLGKWLPSFSRFTRPLVPGEVAVFLADTGTGKTAILQNIAFRASITTLLFELELPGTLTFERFFALSHNQPCKVIEANYRATGEPSGLDFRKLKHVWTCSSSGVRIADMRRLLEASELKIGHKPAMVMVDYIQLVSGDGRTRYERTSTVAEQLKVFAKETNTIVIAASQVGRKDYSDGPDIALHDGKNAGEIENSSGLVVGAWRDEKEAGTLILKVLKNTKGTAGGIVKCNFNGETMLIAEQANVAGSGWDEAFDGRSKP
jgi:hypothetical protein